MIYCSKWKKLGRSLVYLPFVTHNLVCSNPAQIWSVFHVSFHIVPERCLAKGSKLSITQHLALLFLFIVLVLKGFFYKSYMITPVQIYMQNGNKYQSLSYPNRDQFERHMGYLNYVCQFVVHSYQYFKDIF